MNHRLIHVSWSSFAHTLWCVDSIVDIYVYNSVTATITFDTHFSADQSSVTLFLSNIFCFLVRLLANSFKPSSLSEWCRCCPHWWCYSSGFMTYMPAILGASLLILIIVYRTQDKLWMGWGISRFVIWHFRATLSSSLIFFIYEQEASWLGTLL